MFNTNNGPKVAAAIVVTANVRGPALSAVIATTTANESLGTDKKPFIFTIPLHV